MKLGLVGCGNIGADLCNALSANDMPAEIVALTDIDPGRTKKFIDEFHLRAVACSLDENAARADLVIECAVAAVVPEVLSAVISYGKSCLIMSVGGLLISSALLERARQANIQVRIPSGALVGLDGMRSAKEAGIDRVVLTTRKPPAGLAGAPYVVSNGIDLDGLTEATVIFEGTALDAVKAFPKNVNVAAALSLAGIGPERTTVRVIADPAATRNCHEIVAEGAFGRLQAQSENVASPRNPKSSYLASLSAIAELRAAAGAFVSKG